MAQWQEHACSFANLGIQDLERENLRRVRSKADICCHTFIATDNRAVRKTMTYMHGYISER
jgi:hypothetical protein